LTSGGNSSKNLAVKCQLTKFCEL